VIAYLITWDLLERAFGKKDSQKAPLEAWTPWALGAGSVAGALLVAFSDTFWFNAVEAEVYGFAMLLVFLITWLSLKWLDHKGTDHGYRLLVLICYLGYLGVGIHLYSLLTIPAVFLLVLVADPGMRKQESSPVWFVGVALYSLVYMVDKFLIIAVLALVLSGIGLLIAEMRKKAPEQAGNLLFVGIPLSAMVVFKLLTKMMKNANSDSIQTTDTIAIAALCFAVLGLFVMTGQSGGAQAKSMARSWRLSFWFAFAAFVGYSTHAYIPIRSALDPNIDENNPEIVIEKPLDLLDASKWTAFNDFVARKQYGSESMIARALHRRADVSHQLLSWPHMSFGGYQMAQYLPFKAGEVRFGEKGTYKFLPEDNEPVVRGPLKFDTQGTLFQGNQAIPFLSFLLFNGLLVWVAWTLWKRNRSVGTYIIALLAIVTLGLVFYMNFADGLGSENFHYKQWIQQGRPAGGPQTVQLEVRDRDYFYTPSFILMGILFGVAIGLAIEKLGKDGVRSRFVRPAAFGLVAVSFGIPFFSNYKEHDRSNVFIPWDYAYNLIMSCAPNSILFTNGDNDTFPLWFIQEVAKVRTDVRVVNLSLGNTGWYIQQILDNEPKLKLENLSSRIKQLEDIQGLVMMRDFQPAAERTLAALDAMMPKQQELVAGLSAGPKRDSLVSARGAEHADKVLSVEKRNLERVLNHRQMFKAVLDWQKNYRSPYLKVQDQLVIGLMLSNPNAPLHFATTVGRENFMGLDRYMNMEGMVFSLQRFSQEQAQGFNAARTRALIDSTYQYRCLETRDCNINQETKRLLYSYNSIYYRVIMDARRDLSEAQNELQGVLTQGATLPKDSVAQLAAQLERRRAVADSIGRHFLDLSLRQFPEEWRSYLVGADLFIVQEDLEGAKALIEKGLLSVPAYDQGEMRERLARLDEILAQRRGGEAGFGAMNAPQAPAPLPTPLKVPKVKP